MALASLLQAQYNGTKPTQVDLGYTQCQVRADHSRFCCLTLYLSLRSVKEAAIHCTPFVGYSWTKLQCGLSSLLQV